MAPTDRRVDLVHAGIRRACPLRIMHFGVLVRPLLARYACAVSGVLRLSRSLSDFAVESRIRLCEDRFSTLCRPMVVPWVKKRRKYGPHRGIRRPAEQGQTGSLAKG